MNFQRDFSTGPLQEGPAPKKVQDEVPDTPLPPGRRRGAFVTGAVLIALWAGFHWDDPASWIVGLPTALIGGALMLLLPASSSPQISPLGGLRFAAFAIVGILRGAIDVSHRSLRPQTLRPGCLVWHTHLPEGRARRLFAVAITLLPGTLTARIEGCMLTVHALDLSDATRAELGTLEAHIAELYRLDPKAVMT